jgi:hypothetical protein
MNKNHRILHMASFSRSGETLLLRCLDAHPNIHVVHQIREPDRKCDLALFRFLMEYQHTDIDAAHPLVKQCGVAPGATIILKNAVWTHAHDFKGFVLARNPFAVIQSFKLINETAEKHAFRQKQISRWAKYIDEQLLSAANEADHLEMICMLYSRKMFPLLELNLPILRYEDFVQQPLNTLKSLLIQLDIPWDARVLESHTLYPQGLHGHGRIKLWEPIHSNSLDSWKARLPKTTVARIYGMTAQLMKGYGYHFKDGELTLRDDLPTLIL